MHEVGPRNICMDAASIIETHKYRNGNGKCLRCCCALAVHKIASNKYINKTAFSLIFSKQLSNLNPLALQ